MNEMQSKLIEMMKFFHSFCMENGLRYYALGGTALGAVRHKGFIPWDDDIDVCMPRKDYEIFVNQFGSWDSRLEVRSNLLGDFDAPFAKVVDLRTKIEMQYAEDNINMNLWIDVFPVDGLPEDIGMVSRIYDKCARYRKILLLVDAKLGEGKTRFRKYSKYLLKPLAKLYGKKRCIDHMENIARQYPYDECQYVGAITWGLYGVGERMLKSEFEQAIEVEFEGERFPAFSCWDSYLRGLYGDYMQLPPVEKRQTHDMIAYLMEE